MVSLSQLPRKGGLLGCLALPNASTTCVDTWCSHSAFTISSDLQSIFAGEADLPWRRFLLWHEEAQKALTGVLQASAACNLGRSVLFPEHDDAQVGPSPHSRRSRRCRPGRRRPAPWRRAAGPMLCKASRGNALRASYLGSGEA